jgi:hypothetical protein
LLINCERQWGMFGQLLSLPPNTWCPFMQWHLCTFCTKTYFHPFTLLLPLVFQIWYLYSPTEHHCFSNWCSCMACDGMLCLMSYIIAFPWQQWCERASLLHYTYTAIQKTWYLRSVTLHTSVVTTVWLLLRSHQRGQAALYLFQEHCSVGSRSTLSIFIAMLVCRANNVSLLWITLLEIFDTPVGSSA